MAGVVFSLGHIVGCAGVADVGSHTTTAARLIPLEGGGAVFDTPGIRQFQLWDISAGEVAGLMPDLRPYVSACRYPDCLHLSEDECAVKDAVADGRIEGVLVAPRNRRSWDRLVRCGDRQRRLV